MKVVVVFVFLVVFSAAHAQKGRFTSLLNNGKAEFSKEFDQQDYAKAVGFLEKAVKMNPTHAEARYFLGYAYCRLSAFDGNGMIYNKLELTRKASEQLEQVNRLEPEYKGERLALGPYSKIASQWGAQAMSYLYREKTDSAIWAFKQGKARGGFGDYVLALNRKVLDVCSQDAILISSGDNFTFPLWYLQQVEGYRTDVAVVDVSLLNSDWYPRFLSQHHIVSFDLPDTSLDTLQYCVWEDSTIQIDHFQWTVKPSYYGHYLLRGDRIFLSLLRANRFQREVFFTFGFIEESRLSLGGFLSSHLAADRLVAGHIQDSVLSENELIAGSTLALSSLCNTNSHDEVFLLNVFRYRVLNAIENCLGSGDKSSARRYFDLLDQYMPDNQFPYQFPEDRQYAAILRAEL